MAIDRKYGRVTCEFGDIGEDEPVVVFRAQDRTTPRLLDAYYAICADDGSPPEHLDGIDANKAAVLTWQATHPTKTPGVRKDPG